MFALLCEATLSLFPKARLCRAEYHDYPRTVRRAVWVVDQKEIKALISCESDYESLRLGIKSDFKLLKQANSHVFAMTVKFTTPSSAFQVQTSHKEVKHLTLEEMELVLRRQSFLQGSISPGEEDASHYEVYKSEEVYAVQFPSVYRWRTHMQGRIA